MRESLRLVLDLDGTNRAGVGASAATDAVILVGGDGDVVNLDDANRASVSAGTAADASIRINNGLRHVVPLSWVANRNPLELRVSLNAC